MSQRRVVVTGMGIVSPVGNTLASAWDGITNGRSGIGPLTQFDASAYNTRIAGIVKEALGHKFHWAVADYLQRSARHIASATDVRQAYEVGAKAVELALAGHNAVMPTIERTSDVPYRYRIGTAPLAKVANVEKFMPRNFITKDGFGITDKGGVMALFSTHPPIEERIAALSRRT